MPTTESERAAAEWNERADMKRNQFVPKKERVPMWRGYLVEKYGGLSKVADAFLGADLDSEEDGWAAEFLLPTQLKAAYLRALLKHDREGAAR